MGPLKKLGNKSWVKYASLSDPSDENWHTSGADAPSRDRAPRRSRVRTRFPGSGAHKAAQPRTIDLACVGWLGRQDSAEAGMAPARHLASVAQMRAWSRGYQHTHRASKVVLSEPLCVDPAAGGHVRDKLLLEIARRAARDRARFERKVLGPNALRLAQPV